MDSSTHNSKDEWDMCNHTLAQQLHTAALYMNMKLHERARVQKASFSEKSEKLATLHIAAAWKEIDPELLNFITLMTQTLRHNRQILFPELMELAHVQPRMPMSKTAMNAFLEEAKCDEEVSDSQLQTEGQEESDQYVEESDG